MPRPRQVSSTHSNRSGAPKDFVGSELAPKVGGWALRLLWSHGSLGYAAAAGVITSEAK